MPHECDIRSSNEVDGFGGKLIGVSGVILEESRVSVTVLTWLTK